MVKSAFKIVRDDLEALPADAFDKKFGEKTRTVADIVYEINLVNDHIGLTIRNEELFPWPEGGWITAPEDFRAKETVVAAFSQSSERFIQTVEGFSEEQFLEPIMSDDRETNRFERCRFVAVHLWYHCGQLNFIQTILGDDEWHWT